MQASALLIIVLLVGGCSQPKQQDDYQAAFSCAVTMMATSVQWASDNNPYMSTAAQAASTFVDRAMYEGEKIGKTKDQVGDELKASSKTYVGEDNKLKVPENEIKACRDQL